VKGGPGSDLEMQHPQGQESFYRWKFRINNDFIGSSSFCHIYQNKAKGGSDDGQPVITLTLRGSTNILELRHDGGDTGTSLGVIASADLDRLRGNWVECYLRQVHSENGELEFTMREMSTGITLMSHTDLDIDLWRTGGSYNRPKWGMYRKRVTGLRDEEIRFADFCVSETSQVQCPADVVDVPDTEAPTAPTNLAATNVRVTNVDLSWEAATDVYGVTAYDVFVNGNFNQTVTNLTTTVENLTENTAYTFTVKARDAAGNISAASNAVMETTLDPNVSPAVATDLFPLNDATNVDPQSILSWQAGNFTNEFEVYFGIDENNLPLVSTQTETTYAPLMAEQTTYFWKIKSSNDNGFVETPVQSFTTGSSNPDFPWLIYHGNARPEIESSIYYLQDEPAIPPRDEVISDPDPNFPNNKFFGFLSDGTDSKFRWRHDLEDVPADGAVTIVARFRAIDPESNGICYFEVRNNGWREKIRINHSNLKLERANVNIDYNFDWTDEFHIFRMVSDGKNTTVYLDEQTVATITGTSPDENSSREFEWGNSSGSTVYGAYIDWIALNKTGGFAPGEGDLPILPPDIPLAVDEADENQEEATTSTLKVMPNPGRESINLQNENWNNQTIQIKFYNPLGEIVSNKKVVDVFNNQPINLNTAHLEKGIYYILIQPEKSRREVVRWIKH
ncbi:MAG: T9SS type A sorting domain-containing protein, partial [Saprospiraceae bacterium]